MRSDDPDPWQTSFVMLEMFWPSRFSVRAESRDGNTLTRWLDCDSESVVLTRLTKRQTTERLTRLVSAKN
jgi:hypothetical protein